MVICGMALPKHCPCPCLDPSPSPAIVPVGCCSPGMRPSWMVPVAAEAGGWACPRHNTLSLRGGCVLMETHNMSFKFGVFLSAETIVPIPPVECGSLVLQRLWCHHRCWPLVPYCDGGRVPTGCSCTSYLPAATGEEAGEAITPMPLLPISRGAPRVGMRDA